MISAILAMLVKGLGAAGVSEPIIQPLAKGILGGIAAIALVLLVNKVVDEIGDARENSLRLDAAEQALEDTGIADGVDTELERVNDAQEEAVEGAIDDAVEDHPQSTSNSVGAASANVLDELRRQSGTRDSE